MKQFSIKPTSVPASLALTLADAKRQVFIESDETAYDDSLTDLIKAATAQVEEDAQICLLQREWTLMLQRFPTTNGGIQLPYPPLVEIDAINYTDPDGNAANLAPADLTIFSDNPAVIWRGDRSNWPYIKSGTLVEVLYTSGHADAASIPEQAKHAIQLLVAHWFKNREAVGNIGQEVALAYERLIDSIRTNHCFDELGVMDE